MLTRYCNYCGKVIPLQPHHIIKGEGRYCSHACWSSSYWEAKKLYKTIRRIFRCHNCGWEIIEGKHKFEQAVKPIGTKGKKIIRWHIKCPEGADPLRQYKINQRKVGNKV